MVITRKHLAHANIAEMRTDYDDPKMAGFIARLDPLNAIADNSSGFIWRLDDDSADDTVARVFDSTQLIFNMSVWESIEALEDYAYKSNHAEAVRKRAQWFVRPTRSPLVLWWIEAGRPPGVEEAKTKFDLLWEFGPSPEAFTFSNRYPP